MAECSSSKLKSFPTDLPGNITYLILRGTGITELLPGNLSLLPELEAIEITSNPLSRVYKGAFEGLPRLQRLAFTKDNVNSSVFENGVLDSLTGLQELVLTDNIFDEIPVPMIHNLKSLKKLDISVNKIKGIEATTVGIGSLELLVKIDLSHNDINIIQEKAFEGLHNLEELYLQSNQIPKILENTFFNLPKLKTLRLDDNEVSKITDYFCQYMPSVEYVDLSRNHIGKGMGDGTFDGCKSMTTLLLSDNSIADVSTRMFGGMAILRTLYLDKNSITRVPLDAFHHLPKLEILSLDDNDIQEVKARAFGQLTGLISLSLSRQPNLPSIDEQALRGINHLSALSLTGNPKMDVLKPVHVKNLEELVSIHIFDNNFRTLDGDMFWQKPQLTSALIHGNPLVCDCALVWIPKAVRSKMMWASDWLSSSTPPRCALPVHLTHKEIAHMLPQDLTCTLGTITPVSSVVQCLEEGHIATIKV